MASPRRRERRLAALAIPFLLALLEAPLSACGPGPAREHSKAGTAMGTFVEMKVVSRDAKAAARALDEAFDVLQHVEAIATPHDTSSELSHVNARTDSTFTVSPEIDSILRASLRVAEESGGAFDPTVGGLVALWGFPEHPALPDSAKIAEARAHVGWRGLRPLGDGPDPSTGRAAWVLHDPATRLDFGGIACGWAIDRAADRLEACGSCLINVGGDIAVRGRRADGQRWLIGIQHPRDRSKLVRKLRVPPGLSVTTSGDYEHFFEVGGVRYHHILDPATGYPARGLVSCTVIAPTCVDADAWAKMPFVVGMDEGLRRLEAHPGLEGILIALGPDGELVFRETPGVAAWLEP
jgi:thiamine biosynthesis lipoprotein